MFYNFILKYFLLHEWNFIISNDAYIFIDIIMYVWCEYLYFLLFQQIYLMLISKSNKRLIFSPWVFFHIFYFTVLSLKCWILNFKNLQRGNCPCISYRPWSVLLHHGNAERFARNVTLLERNGTLWYGPHSTT